MLSLVSAWGCLQALTVLSLVSACGCLQALTVLSTMSSSMVSVRGCLQALAVPSRTQYCMPCIACPDVSSSATRRSSSCVRKSCAGCEGRWNGRPGGAGKPNLGVSLFPSMYRSRNSPRLRPDFLNYLETNLRFSHSFWTPPICLNAAPTRPGQLILHRLLAGGGAVVSCIP